MCLRNVVFFLAVKEQWEHLFSVTISCSISRWCLSLSFEENFSGQTWHGVSFVSFVVPIFISGLLVSERNPPCFTCLCISKTCRVEKVFSQHSIFFPLDLKNWKTFQKRSMTKSDEVQLIWEWGTVQKVFIVCLFGQSLERKQHQNLIVNPIQSNPDYSKLLISCTTIIFTSMDFCMNAIYIFFSFSALTATHFILAKTLHVLNISHSLS